MRKESNMRVFKFGGASIKDAEAIRNMVEILKGYTQEPLLVVVSAIHKTTNKLEKTLESFRAGLPHQELLAEVKAEHEAIAQSLFSSTEYPRLTLQRIYQQMEETLQQGQGFSQPQHYDSFVSMGEVLSSTLIHQYLQLQELPYTWVDARQLIKTDASFREAKVNWNQTKVQVKQMVKPLLSAQAIITQGFIGSDEKGQATTLGREGSDYSAAILATCLDAQSVTIWKDVPGILNADPKLYPDAEKYAELSYHEAAEMTYYGASVIHPKTIRPLATQQIPLHVKSFAEPSAAGTIIHGQSSTHFAPAIIVKKQQCLITFQLKDFNFINENDLSKIFHQLDLLNIKLNMMQNSATSFSICVDQQDYKIEPLLEALQNDFSIRYNTGLILITVKNYDETSIEKVAKHQKVYLEQRTRKNYQMVVKDPQPG